MRNSFNGIVEEIQALAGDQPESQAQVAVAIHNCRALEAVISRHLSEKQRLEEVNRQLQIALSRQEMDNEQLLQRLVEQEVTLSCFQRAFPTLEEGMRDLLGAWQSLGKPGVYHTA